MTTIYCVKIRRKLLKSLRRVLSDSFHVFPYDRVYLVPKTKVHVIPRMFPYCLEMPLTIPLLDALNQVHVEYVRKVPLHRDSSTETATPTKTYNFFEGGKYTDWSGWAMVVPTQIKQHCRPENIRNVGVKHLQYVHSGAMRPYANTRAEMPSIKLHTPERTIALLCAVCDHILEYQAGKCVPGTGKCEQQGGAR